MYLETTGYWKNQKGNQKISRKKWQSMTTQNLWDAAKTVLRRKFIAIQSYPQEIRKTSNRQLNFTPKTIVKRRTKKKKNPKISRRKEITKIWEK